MLFQLYTISFAKTNGIRMPTVIMVVKVKDNQPVKASGKHCWLRHVGYWLLFDLIYLSNGTILQHLQKGKWIDVYQSKYLSTMLVLKTHIYIICLMFEIKQILILKRGLEIVLLSKHSLPCMESSIHFVWYGRTSPMTFSRFLSFTENYCPKPILYTVIQ